MAAGVRHLLILGSLPGRTRLAAVAAPGRRVVSTSPWLSAQLQAAGIAHRGAERYAPARWEPFHAGTARSLLALSGRARQPPDGVWLDDWSHLLVAELRTPRFWEEVARGLLRVEQPREVLLQRVARSSAAAASLALLATAFDGLGVEYRTWPR